MRPIAYQLTPIRNLRTFDEANLDKAQGDSVRVLHPFLVPQAKKKIVDLREMIRFVDHLRKLSANSWQPDDILTENPWKPSREGQEKPLMSYKELHEQHQALLS